MSSEGLQIHDILLTQQAFAFYNPYRESISALWKKGGLILA